MELGGGPTGAPAVTWLPRLRPRARSSARLHGSLGFARGLARPNGYMAPSASPRGLARPQRLHGSLGFAPGARSSARTDGIRAASANVPGSTERRRLPVSTRGNGPDSHDEPDPPGEATSGERGAWAVRRRREASRPSTPRSTTPCPPRLPPTARRCSASPRSSTTSRHRLETADAVGAHRVPRAHASPTSRTCARRCAPPSTDYKVYKNTLARRAAHDAGFDELADAARRPGRDRLRPPRRRRRRDRGQGAERLRQDATPTSS